MIRSASADMAAATAKNSPDVDRAEGAYLTTYWKIHAELTGSGS